VFRWIPGVAVGAALLVLAVGCGGGGDSSTEVTKVEFTKQAKAICAERDNKWAAQIASSEKDLKTADVSANKEKASELISSELVPLMEDELSKLEALEAPAGDEGTISKMWKARSKAIAEIEADPLSISRSASLASFSAQARAYGLECPL
jgi:hypothetical protein